MLDFNKIKTYPLKDRDNKFTLESMLDPAATKAGEDANISALAQKIIQAKKNDCKVVAMLGGAVIKEGCGALLIDLMRKGFIDHIAGNGSVSVHDFEIALIGETSEDVEHGLRDGTFGMAEETGAMLNRAINVGYSENIGYGEAVGKMIVEKKLPHSDYSVLAVAYELKIPATIHVAIGGDIIHQHPECDGAAIGATTYTDFKLLTETVASLKSGVVLNIGSAVIMPEAFLKALTIARNLGAEAEDFTTANFDFFDMYRPRTRIVEWPKTLGCDGIDIRGHHRDTVSALHAQVTA